MFNNMYSEKEKWVYLTFSINLMWFQLKYKNKVNGVYRALSTSNNKLVGLSNHNWFRNSFSGGYYRSSILSNKVEYYFFIRLSDNEFHSDQRKLRELNIRCRKLGAVNIEINNINTINTTDEKFLSSKFGKNAYREILKVQHKSNIQDGVECKSNPQL